MWPCHGTDIAMPLLLSCCKPCTVGNCGAGTAWSSVAPGAHYLPSSLFSFGFTPQQLLGLRQIQNSAPKLVLSPEEGSEGRDGLSLYGSEGAHCSRVGGASALPPGLCSQPHFLFQMWMSVQQRPLPAAMHSTVRMSTAHTHVKVTRVLGPVILHRASLSSFNM